MVIGGPGAVFWMWVIALLGMMTKCVEVTLGQYYRIQGKDGVYYGGPMYYIERGMGKKWKPLAIFFAVTIILGGLGTAAFAQPYTMSTALERTFHIPAWVVTVAAAAICGIVLIGGVKGIGKFCEKITPAMCLIYVVGALGVIIVNIRFVPQAFAAIFKYAFAPMPAIGGLAGSTVMDAKVPMMMDGNFKPGFKIDLHIKARPPSPPRLPSPTIRSRKACTARSRSLSTPLSSAP